MDVDSLPLKPGVYLLKNKQGQVIYIGKSINIKNRVRAHLKNLSWHIAPSLPNPLRNETASADYVISENEPEALIKESELIKKYQPKYNIMLRDDKQYFYVCFRERKLPILYITHQPTTPRRSSLLPGRGKLPPPSPTLRKEGDTQSIGHPPLLTKERGVGEGVFLGPFTDGKSLKMVLRYLRKIFPYYTQQHRKLPCSYCHIGLCPGPNPDPKEYRKNIAKIKAILNGKKPRVLSVLKKEMGQYAKNLEFEKAAKARGQIRALENVFEHSRPLLDLPLLKGERLFPPLKKGGLGGFSSLEAYDISNIQGKEPVASMVRFDNGKPNKSLYRRFKIRLPETPNDYAMIREVIRRRLAHPEWPYPDLFLVDGGRGQLNAALKEIISENPSLTKKGQAVVVGIAKRFNELYIPDRKNPLPLSKLPEGTKNLLMYARDEAHRFAISYHRKLHRQTFQ